ncbi:MAG TPA: LCP family protein [Niallia sp.]|nr:LCP family protein [Niallia sp.]
MNRHKKKREKKKRKIRRIFLLLFLIIIALIGYAVFQYYQGVKGAGESGISNSGEEIEFNGAKRLDKVNVLLLGVDSRGEEQSRTDTMMIAQYDPKNDSAKVISLMRDIYAEIPGYKNYKINTAFFLGGPELLRQTIKQNFDLDIHYYAIVDFKGFEQVVDTIAPDGIEMNVEKRMSEKIGVVIEPGLQKLDGEELLGYARFRQDAEGDFGRVKRQQEVINALKDEMISVSGVAKLPKLLGTIQPYIETNLQGIDLLDLSKDFILNPPDQIDTLRIPVDNSYTNTSYSHAGSVLEIDFEANKQAIEQFLNGEAVTTETENDTDVTEDMGEQP